MCIIDELPLLPPKDEEKTEFWEFCEQIVSCVISYKQWLRGCNISTPPSCTGLNYGNQCLKWSSAEQQSSH